MSRFEQDGRDHRQAWDLIPWVVNGTASADQTRLVESHVLDCEDCSRELGFQQSLCAAVSAPSGEGLDPQRSFHKLRPQLDAVGEEVAALGDGAAEPRRGSNRPARSWRFQTRALLAAVVIEAVALAALGNTWWLQVRSGRTEASYHVLASGPAASSAAIIRVVFAPDVTVESMQVLLAGAGLQIVAGPSEAGVFSLGSRAAYQPVTGRAALAFLRSNPQVRFAEPVADSMND